VAIRGLRDGMQPLLLSYYGDDLTGSTDVMEALTLGGVETVLFTRIPDVAHRARFPNARAIGLAGTSRSQSPAWMDEHLTPAFAWLRSLGAKLCHYKVCSTFDSSPDTGNIGRAIEIGRGVFGQAAVPLLVGTPQLKRYTAFGHLFAAYRGKTYRIDRHPVMSRHPVTPMAEADLLVHLSRQTRLPSALIDLATLRGPDAAAAVDRGLAESAIVLFDVADEETQGTAGAELWRIAPATPFCVGSSGVEYALIRQWSEQGIAQKPSGFAPLEPVERIAVVSGSVSPTTETQIRHAEGHGFVALAIDPLRLAADTDAAIAEATSAALAQLGEGRSVILYTALGPGADVGARIDQDPGARHRLGRGLGDILGRLVRQAALSRAVIAGGDTSSHALGQLGVDALTLRMPLPQTPGSPLCTAHSSDPAIDGLQLAMKGGQIGNDDYFSAMRDGKF